MRDLQERTAGKRAERRLAVLGAVVEGHAESGRPVGSRVVAERLKTPVSSATVRAAMHELEAEGLLTHVHTSSGRVPTDLGYRTYLEQVLPHQARRAGGSGPMAQLDWADGELPHQLLRRAVALVSAAGGGAALVAAPPLERSVLERIRFVPLSEQRLLAVVVTRGGVVHERVLEPPREAEGSRGRRDWPAEPATLETLENYLNGALRGVTLREIRGRLERRRRQDAEDLDRLQALALELGRRALANAEGAELLVDGAAEVFEYDEFSQPGRAARLMRSLAEQDRWLAVLARLEDAGDARVYLGGEAWGGHEGASAPWRELEDCAVVAGGYKARAGSGMVALLGPKRLDYRRALPVVRDACTRLSTLLGGATAGASHAP